MKKTISLMAWIALMGTAYLSNGQAQAFRNFIIAANSPTNPKMGREAFLLLGGEERFELPFWGSGRALSRGDEVIGEGYEFNFDYEKNDLYVRHLADNQEVVVDKNSVRRFTLYKGTDSLLFVKSIAIDPQNKTFFQLLAGDTQGKVALLRLRSAKLIPVNKNDYMRNFNGDYTPHYQNSITYYIVDAEKGVKLLKNPSKKDILAIYPEASALLNETIPGKHLEEVQLVAFINRLNSI